MKEDINSIIRQLERAQDLLAMGKASEAQTVIYSAQCDAIFLRDNK